MTTSLTTRSTGSGRRRRARAPGSLRRHVVAAPRSSTSLVNSRTICSSSTARILLMRHRPLAGTASASPTAATASVPSSRPELDRGLVPAVRDRVESSSTRAAETCAGRSCTCGSYSTRVEIPIPGEAATSWTKLAASPRVRGRRPAWRLVLLPCEGLLRAHDGGDLGRGRVHRRSAPRASWPARPRCARAPPSRREPGGVREPVERATRQAGPASPDERHRWSVQRMRGHGSMIP